MQRSLLKFFLLVVMALVLIPSSEAQNKKKRKKIARVLSAARTYMGAPYQYGGMSHSGIDCSGLMYNCFSAVGVKLPRTAKQQSKYGRRKGWGSVREGDIVFFKFKKKGRKWFHSGVISYAEKDDIRFIHASTSRGVVESSLNQEYYRDNVKKFRRVIR